MSWAAHDPEGWTEVCIRGILAKLDRSRGLTQPCGLIDREGLEDLAGSLNGYNVFLALCDWAQSEIAEAESAYFTG